MVEENENNNNVDGMAQNNNADAEDTPVAFSTDDYLSQIQPAYSELYDFLRKGPVYFKVQELEPRLSPQITHFIHQSDLAKLNFLLNKLESIESSISKNAATLSILLNISTRELIQTKPQAAFYIQTSIRLLKSCSPDFIQNTISDIINLSDYLTVISCELQDSNLAKDLLEQFHRFSSLYTNDYKTVLETSRILTPFEVFIRQIQASDFELITENIEKLNYLEIQRYPVKTDNVAETTEIPAGSKKRDPSTLRKFHQFKKSHKMILNELRFPRELFLRFCYYSSIILTVQKKYETALFYLEMVLSNKGEIGLIHLESLKKYWVIKILCKKQNFKIPTADETAVLRGIQKLKQFRRTSAFQVPRSPANESNFLENSGNPDFIHKDAYQSLHNGFIEVLENISSRVGFGMKKLRQNSLKFSDFCRICQKYKSQFESDGNYGLVVRLKYELIHRCIIKLAQIFTCLPMSVFEHCLDCGDFNLVQTSLKELHVQKVLNWEVINTENKENIIKFSVIQNPEIINFKEIQEMIESVNRMKQASDELVAVNIKTSEHNQFSDDKMSSF